MFMRAIQETELSSKEKLLRMVKQMHKKRKIKKVLNTKLTVEGVDSPLVADKVMGISYKGTPSIRVRKSLRSIIDSNSECNK